jgi:shikimate dehydrogenase
VTPVAECYSLDDLKHFPVLAPPARLAVIGDPIAHSKSPQMHNPALRARGIDAQYVRVRVPVGSVASAFRDFAAAGFLGINVTIPHKFEALDAVDVVDPLARTLGAVNTVHVRDGRLHGFNTDGPGFLRSVKEAFGKEVRDLRVLVLGAGGGAGRAVAVQSALVQCQRLVLVNRTQSKAQQLRSDLESMPASADVTKQIEVIDWNDDALKCLLPEIDLIVNGTSLGMKADDAPLIPADSITSGHLVFDMVYRAGGLPTQLGSAARSANAAYVDGATLLLHQGAISFEHWFGGEAPVEVMRAGLAAALVP